MRTHTIRWLGSIVVALAIATNHRAAAQGWEVFPDSSGPAKVFAYSEKYGSAATGQINPDATLTTFRDYDSGQFGGWSHVVGCGSEILFYDKTSGTMALGHVDLAGDFHTTMFRSAYFIPGWDTIVIHNGYLLFYDKESGYAVAGRFDNDAFRPYGYWPSLGANFTHIVSTAQGLLFYNADNGDAVRRDWTYASVPTGGPFFQIVGVGLESKPTKPWIAAGWTHIVDSGDGVLFYNASNGYNVMTDLYSDGTLSTRFATARIIQSGYTSVVAGNHNVLFYDTANGDVAIGAVRQFDWSGGALAIRAVYPAYFLPDRSQIVTYVDPVF
jgi:hypothetical protein